MAQILGRTADLPQGVCLSQMPLVCRGSHGRAAGRKARPGKDSGSFPGNSGGFKSRCPQGPPGTLSAEGTLVRRGCLPAPAWHTQPQLIFGFLRRPRNDGVCGGLHPSTFSCLDVCRGPFRGPWTRGAAVQRGLNRVWPPSIARRVTLLLVVGITVGSCFFYLIRLDFTSTQSQGPTWPRNSQTLD